MELLDFAHHPRTRAIVAEIALAVFAFYSDPLGITAQKGRAVDNLFEASTQYAYPTQAADKLAVVLIDADTLSSWQVDWPVTYDKTAEVIHALACAKVSGVFFDYTMSKTFAPDVERKTLEATIADSSKTGPNCIDGLRPARIKVYFGKAEGIRSPLGDRLDQSGAAFWLESASDDSLYFAGRTKFPEHLNIKEKTPAFGILQSIPDLINGTPSDVGELCEPNDSRPRCWTNPLALVWSGGINRDQGAVSQIDACRGKIGWFQTLMNLLDITSDGRYETCPPLLTLRGRDLFRDHEFIAHNGDPLGILAGRFVFVGTQLSGLNDQVYSPVHGYLPGVYKHAMAVDNLITYRADYPTIPRPWMIYPIILLIYGAIESARELTGLSSRTYWLVGATSIGCVLGFLAIVHFWHWPISLVFAVFGYYGGSLLFFKAAGQTPSNATPPVSQLE
jgi:hypothetical protein